MSPFFASGGQSIGVSASASVLPMNIQDWYPLGLTGWIFLLFQGPLKKSSPTPQFKSTNSLVPSFFIVQLSHPYMTIGKTIQLYWLPNCILGHFFNILWNWLLKNTLLIRVYIYFESVNGWTKWGATDVWCSKTRSEHLQGICISLERQMHIR